MKKIEIIWRELLWQVLEKKNNRFVQQELAERFGFSTSTVFQSLIPLRRLGAVRVGGREFGVEDPEKVLLHWANRRQLGKDLLWRTRTGLPVAEIEKLMPPTVVYGAYSAYRSRFADTPADYGQVWVYSSEERLGELKQRFVGKKGPADLFVLRADFWLTGYGQITSLGQTFVDLWNLSEWYAKEYVLSLKRRIDAVLS